MRPKRRSTSSSTAAEEVGALGAEEATSLREAFAVVSAIRLAHHVENVRAGRAPDNLVDPGALTPFARADLREAFHAIAASQKRLGYYVPLGVGR